MKTRVRFLTAFASLAITATAAEAPKQHKTSNAPFLKPKEAVAKMDV
ncbi:MAG: hypothetical protein HC841_09505, partial [Verrucomicrobiae bacterium]|nr:hypothetical protein [Verrucomicrobiae bacterium]